MMEYSTDNTVTAGDVTGPLSISQESQEKDRTNDIDGTAIEKVSTPPPVTHALEALLGGLDAPTEDAQVEDIHMKDAPKAEDLLETGSAPESEVIPCPELASGLEKASIIENASSTETSSRPDDTQKSDSALGHNDVLPETTVAEEEDHPEWEVDSSPIQSSSEDSSSDDSSSEDDSDEEGDNAYKLLSPEEQAKILMEGDGGSDDEGGNKAAKGSGGQLRTKNEVPEEVIPKPDVTITPEMNIEELGVVEGIVENVLLIKAKISGEYRVLESGSVLCLGDRSVIGVVSETLGRVQQPLYSVRFTNAGEITEAGLAVGTTVFYSEQHSKYVFTQALKAYKGSDASNLHDEEVGDEEIEFSDDEAEMEHKRRLKQRRLEKRGGKIQHNGDSRRGGHQTPQPQTTSDQGPGLDYDDAEDDGPYKPLSRPTGFASTIGRTEAPQEGGYSGIHGDRNVQYRGRGRGDRGRARGDRGRASDRGRGRGGHQDRRGDSKGYSLPPQNRSLNQYPAGQYGPTLQSPAGHVSHGQSGISQGPGFPQSPQTLAPNFYSPQQNEYSPHQPQMWPQFPPQPPYQQVPNTQNGWPGAPPAYPLPSGAFINPAFFGSTQNGGPGDANNKR